MKELIEKLKEKFQFTTLTSKEECLATTNPGYYLYAQESCFFKLYPPKNDFGFRYSFKISKNNDNYEFTHNILNIKICHSAKTAEELILKIENCFTKDYLLKLINEHFEHLQYKNTYNIEKIKNGFNIKFIDSSKDIFTEKTTFEKYSLFSSLVNVSLLDDNSINLELI